MSSNTLSKAELIALVSLTVGTAAVGALVYKTFFSKKTNCKSKVNLDLQKDNPKVVHAFDIEDLGDKAVYCRCWRSKKTMDSSVALGRLELKSPVLRPDSDHCDPVHEKRVEDGRRVQLENGFVPLSHQVAGHKYGVDKVGILQHPDGTVLKQLQPPPRGPREMQFYTKVFAGDSSEPCLLDLQRYLPTYYGTWSSPSLPDDLYLKLEDVTRRFHKPCVMDVKIGQRSYDPFASPEKREQQINKYPLMEEIGFLILGMRVYQVNSDTYETYDQHYGRNLVKDSLRDGLAKFFHNGNGLKKDAVSVSIQKVQEVLQWFEGQSQFHFYASSLLFVYEGSLSEDTHDAPETGRGSRGVTEDNNNHVHCEADAPRERDCTGRHQPDIAPCSKEDRTARKRGPRISPKQPDGNEISDQWKKERVSPGQPSLVGAGGDVEVRMIDFAHVFPSETRDEGYIYGLKCLLSGLQQILDQ
ncbi:hypothetical protein AAFF_G00136040 [Aldrovandia affinis]|uniref:Kinase n=1 Tax=Aldrovandia affinis TaxID=143900 RepID=A0AAD7RQD4_9TELE|nr:hypothetical protein AAFF_G00136040 [Aldrovandia affinis]